MKKLLALALLLSLGVYVGCDSKKKPAANTAPAAGDTEKPAGDAAKPADGTAPADPNKEP